METQNQTISPAINGKTRLNAVLDVLLVESTIVMQTFWFSNFISESDGWSIGVQVLSCSPYSLSELCIEGPNGETYLKEDLDQAQIERIDQVFKRLQEKYRILQRNTKGGHRRALLPCTLKYEQDGKNATLPA